VKKDIIKFISIDEKELEYELFNLKRDHPSNDNQNKNAFKKNTNIKFQKGGKFGKNENWSKGKDKNIFARADKNVKGKEEIFK